MERRTMRREAPTLHPAWAGRAVRAVSRPETKDEAIDSLEKALEDAELDCARYKEERDELAELVREYEMTIISKSFGGGSA